jgi:hypothetical protein
MKLFSKFFLLIFASLLVLSCSNEVDINAPEKPIWAVYGVLNPQEPVQYIRVATGFQPESNALDYARENDLSVKGLQVSLLSESGKRYLAQEEDSLLKQPEDGTFFPFQTLYRFDTDGQDALVAGEKYTLRITRPGDDVFELTSETAIPLEPNIVRPALTLCSGNGRGLQALSLDKETRVEWARKTAQQEGSVGFAYELRSFLAYEEDGQPDTVSFGPTRMLENPGGCGSASTFCYRFREKELLSTFLTRMDQQAGRIYTMVDSPTCAQPEMLSKAFWFEVTAMDSFLTNYRLANDPKFTDFTTARPEFTNIQSTELTVGIFGSINIVKQYATFNKCTRYLMNLNGERQPSPSCTP